jgi:hypothetical protein
MIFSEEVKLMAAIFVFSGVIALLMVFVGLGSP